MTRGACKDDAHYIPIPIANARTHNAPASDEDGALVKQEIKVEVSVISKEECTEVYSTPKKKQEDIPVFLEKGFSKSEPVIDPNTRDDDDSLLDDSMETTPESGWVEEEVIEDGDALSLPRVTSRKAPKTPKKKQIRTIEDRKKEYAKWKGCRERLREISEKGSGAEAEEARKELAELTRKLKQSQELAYKNRRDKLARTRELVANDSGTEAELARKAISNTATSELYTRVLHSEERRTWRAEAEMKRNELARQCRGTGINAL